MEKIIIALDGHAGCGKSTTAKAVAKELDYIFIDTGAMYRAVTYYFLSNNVDFSDAVEVENALKEISLKFVLNPSSGIGEIHINGENVEPFIRNMEITSRVSDVASIKAVRVFNVAEQQKMGKEKGIVMDGRDIGTVVFPNAELKIFMTADVTVRAKRRLVEMESKGVETSLEDVESDIRNRDHLDSTRKESPLKKADDAVVVDTSGLTINQQVESILKLAKNIISV
ncbi:(d)CMP kinase [Flammeovirga kamogawensis]|uniref:Cytidylate kinase n=1 Tax=Flammeovirga kamogawensis TaxID=373891 RepID=A0ABX8GW46_9BACT|nr:(d)CMP kinase [Flammeovirga kamogawensis]MBB6464042.1 cytidylate kinase [Flammeovirga kamogawensis]QWG07372.1 (d)CMP kinase [Flammeovirga kamogawensis]TRX69187.1 (d)CMP kinase [Flammeovirga kamogawensis]